MMVLTAAGDATSPSLILPKQKREYLVSPNKPIVNDLTVGVQIVPWTPSEENTARSRYYRLPRLIENWLMQKYTVRPQDWYFVTVPPPPKEDTVRN